MVLFENSDILYYHTVKMPGSRGAATFIVHPKGHNDECFTVNVLKVKFRTIAVNFLTKHSFWGNKSATLMLQVQSFETYV